MRSNLAVEFEFWKSADFLVRALNIAYPKCLAKINAHTDANVPYEISVETHAVSRANDFAVGWMARGVADAARRTADCMACEIATKQRRARGIRETPSIDECPIHGVERNKVQS